MTFTDAETAYLASQRPGRLATIQPDGSPQVKPVGFRYNPGLGTIDVTGFNMTASQKFLNVRRNGRAALVVDDIASAGPWRVRFLEIRGTADAIPPSGPAPRPGSSRPAGSWPTWPAASAQPLATARPDPLLARPRTAPHQPARSPRTGTSARRGGLLQSERGAQRLSARRGVPGGSW